METSSEQININMWFNHKTYQLQLPKQSTIRELALCVSQITSINPVNQTMLIKNYHLPLDIVQTFEYYNIQNNCDLVVLGCNEVAADPKQKLSDIQLQQIDNAQYAKHPVGLINAGQFCYLISGVQALFSIKEEKTLDTKITQFAIEFVKTYNQFIDIKIQHDAQESLSSLEMSLEPLYEQIGGNPFKVTYNDSSEDTFIRCAIKPEFLNLTESVRESVGDKKIIQLPKYMQFHLVRYAYDAEEKQQKIFRRLAYQDVLLLDEVCDDSCKNQRYQLKAIIAHQGLSSNQGHYICYAKHGKKWFCFNDAGVSVVDAEAMYSVQGGAATSFIAYIVIYELESVQVKQQ